MQKPIPIDEEYTFGKGLIISSADTEGTITYVNRMFCEIAGYSKNELINKSHNIIRHPSMPKIIFERLWKTIKEGKEWTGIVKNLRKDGRYYWVYTHISPNLDDGKITGFTAARRPASASEIEEIIPEYTQMLENENN